MNKGDAPPSTKNYVDANSSMLVPKISEYIASDEKIQKIFVIILADW